MNVRKQQCKNLEISAEDIISDYEFLNAFTVGTEEYYPRYYDVNDTKCFQILYQYSI